MMFTRSNLLLVILIFIFISCKFEKENNAIIAEDIIFDLKSEQKFVLNKNFKLGDVRRYGLLSKTDTSSNLRSTKNALNNILNLAEQGLEVTFPQGYYNTNILIAGRENISLTFNNASFSGQIQIIEGANKNPSNNINLKGKVTTFNKFFTRFSTNIDIDTLIIASDTLKNVYKKRSLGCNIYSGTKNLSINKLVVKDLGSGHEYYKYSLAALQIHGWDNNPENIEINEVVIENSDRHGAYITGNNHKINKILIKQFGKGSFEFIDGLEDADLSEIKMSSGLWINKCHNSKFENIIIDCNKVTANYTIKFDEGRSAEPTIIDYLTIKNNNSSLPMLPEYSSNIVVRHYNEIYD